MVDAQPPHTGRGPQAGWHPDPCRRYELRYHNGRDWTADVAVRGERFVDPLGTTPTPIPPPGYALGPAGGDRRPSRPSGLAITSLVLGICAVAIAWLPFVFVAGVVAGVLAIVFGLLGRRDVRRGRAGRAFVTAGLVLGPVAIGLGAVGFWITTEVLELLSPGEYTITTESCASDGTFATLEGTIRNDGERERSYTVDVDFLRSGTNSVVADDTVTVRDVAPGATATWTARARVRVDTIDCEVVSVRGAIPLAGD